MNPLKELTGKIDGPQVSLEIESLLKIKEDLLKEFEEVNTRLIKSIEGLNTIEIKKSQATKELSTIEAKISQATKDLKAVEEKVNEGWKCLDKLIDEPALIKLKPI